MRHRGDGSARARPFASLALAASLALVVGCHGSNGGNGGSSTASRASGTAGATDAPRDALSQPPVPEPGTAIAIFAGGCFWCMEPPFDELDGVVSTTSGYTGGRIDSPTYRQVSSGSTGHLEAIQVVYRPDQIRYAELLEVFWRNVDPFDGGGQFCDRGEQYTTAIFAVGADQRRAAEASKRALQQYFAAGASAGDRDSGDAPERATADDRPKESAEPSPPIVTPVRDAVTFFAAEDYHQNYYETNPLRYKFYRNSCRRDARLDQVWSAVPSSAFDLASAER